MYCYETSFNKREHDFCMNTDNTDIMEEERMGIRHMSGIHTLRLNINLSYLQSSLSYM